jgi:hypothetical protein
MVNGKVLPTRPARDGFDLLLAMGHGSPRNSAGKGPTHPVPEVDLRGACAADMPLNTDKPSDNHTNRDPAIFGSGRDVAQSPSYPARS